MSLITTIESTARMMNASRIVIGGGITHPFGDPLIPLDEERKFRKSLVQKALSALSSKVEKPTIFI